MGRVRGWLGGVGRRSDRNAAEDTALGGDEIREFIHLNETSVMSLLASLEGAVPAELRTTSNLSRSQGVEAEARASVPTVARLGTFSHVDTVTETGMELSRVFTVQAAFGLLRRRLDDRLVLRAHPGGGDVAVGPPVEVHRGDPFEARVRLRAEGMYRASTVLSSMRAIAEEAPEFFGEYLKNPQNAVIGRVLENLLAGWVPIEAELLDYVATTEAGSVRVARQRSGDGGQMPVRIVAVLNERDLWQDARRTLFSELEFTALGRFRSSEAVEDWDPLLVGPVFRQVHDELGAALQALRGTIGSTFSASAANDRATDGADDTSDFLAHVAALGDRFPEARVDAAAAEVDGAVELAVRAVQTSGRKAKGYVSIESWFKAHAALDLDAVELAAVRPVADESSPVDIADGDNVLLEADVLALYW